MTAGPEGRRCPSSQLRTVARLTPISDAKACWDNPRARRILVTRVDHKAAERIFDFAMLHFPTPLPRPWDFQIGVSASAPEAQILTGSVRCDDH